MGLVEITVEPGLHGAAVLGVVVGGHDAVLGKQAIGLHGVGHRQQRRLGGFTGVPTANPAEAHGDQQQRRRGQVPTGLFLDALANQRRVQCRVVRLLQGAAQ